MFSSKVLSFARMHGLFIQVIEIYYMAFNLQGKSKMCHVNYTGVLVPLFLKYHGNGTKNNCVLLLLLYLVFLKIAVDNLVIK